MRRALRIELRARNNRLWHVIHAEAASVAEYCRRHRLPQGSVGDLLNFTESPYAADGAPRKWAARLADLAFEAVEDLFPRELYQTVLPKKFALEVSPEQLAPLSAAAQLALPASQLEAVELDEMQTLIHSAIDSALTPRQKQVIEWRFGMTDEGELTLDAIGKRLRITRERVREIETIALRKLRRPRHSRILRTFDADRDRPHGRDCQCDQCSPSCDVPGCVLEESH